MYEGFWLNDMYHGFGKEVISNGITYIGTWN